MLHFSSTLYSVIKFNNFPPRISSDLELTSRAAMELRNGFDNIINCNNAEHDPGLGDLAAVGNSIGQILAPNICCTPDQSLEVATNLASGLMNQFFVRIPETPHQEAGMQVFLGGVKDGVIEINDAEVLASLEM